MSDVLTSKECCKHEEQALAWETVFGQLRKGNEKFYLGDGTGEQLAVREIERLQQRVAELEDATGWICVHQYIHARQIETALCGCERESAKAMWRRISPGGLQVPPSDIHSSVESLRRIAETGLGDAEAFNEVEANDDAVSRWGQMLRGIVNLQAILDRSTSAPETKSDQASSSGTAPAQVSEIAEAGHSPAWTGDMLGYLKEKLSPETEEPRCANCGHGYGQHTKGPVAAEYCRHCPCPQWREPVSEDASHG